MHSRFPKQLEDIIGIFLFHGTHQEGADLAINKNRSIILAIVFYMIAFMVVLFLGKKFFLNLRYVSVLYVPFYLIGGLGFWYIILFAISSIVYVLGNRRHITVLLQIGAVSC